jgi:hypothetical protein
MEMLMEVVRWLREAGVVATWIDEPVPGAGVQPDAILDVMAGDVGARFAVEERRRMLYPNELSQLHALHHDLSRDGWPLLVVPFVPETVGDALTASGWSWADEQGNFDLRAPGLTLRQRRSAAAPKTRHRTLPRGSGSLGIIRALIRFGEDDESQPGATWLARQAGVSQPRASQVLKQLQDLELVDRSDRGWAPRRADLLDRFLHEYTGPGGSEHYLYSLDGPTEAAVSITKAQTPGHPIVVSADVGPDLLRPWRRPTVAVIYTRRDIAPGPDLVEAQQRHDANLIVRVPNDQSMFRSPELLATVHGVPLCLADESQLIWDLHDLGGADRLEAAGRLREWLLTRR